MPRSLRIFITGGTGLIGRRLVLDRLERGDRLVVLSRDAQRAERLFAARANPNIEIAAGDPSCPGPWQAAVDGCDAVIHLAGASIADRRWTAAYRRAIVESRIDSTHQVVEAINTAARRPSVLVNASAIGFYGETGGDPVDEQNGKGDDFLADLSASWEEQALRAGAGGATRVVLLRTGLVLDTRGGLLARLVQPFRWFVGGPIGRGRQYMSWIHRADVIGLVDHALRTPEVRGPLNIVSPTPVTNHAFSRALGAALGRPSWLPVPPLALRIALGPFAHYALMSQRVLPARAERTGYIFRFPRLDAALENLLGGKAESPATPAVVEAPARAGSMAEPAAPPRRPRLIVVSADGAVTREDRRLPSAMIHAVRAAQREGVVVVIASSRAPRVLAPLVRTLELESPLIAYHGAVIWSTLDREARFHQPLDPETARQAIDIVRTAAPDVRVAVEVLDHWFTDRFVVGPDTPASFEPDEIGALDRFLSEPVSQIDVLGSVDQIAAAKRALGTGPWGESRIAVFQSAPTGLQVVHPRADKGVAVQRIAERLGAAPEEVVAIGAAMSDAGMLGWAGHAYALASAPERLRAIATVELADAHDSARAIRVCLHAPPGVAAPSPASTRIG